MCEKMIIFGLCALLTRLQHGVALPPGFLPVNTPTLSPSPSPSPLALPSPSPSSSPIGSVASPFGDTLFSLPADKPRENTGSRVSRNEDDIEDIETRLSELESSFENMTIIQKDTEVDIETLRTDVDSLQSQMSSVTTSITSIQATVAVQGGSIPSQADIDSLAERVGGLENTQNTFDLSAIDALQEQVNGLESSVDGVSDSIQNMESSFSNYLSEQDAKIDDSTASISDLMSQLAETRAEIGICQTAGGCDDIHTMIERVRIKTAEIKALVQSVSTNSTENTASVGKFTVKFDGMETTIADLQSQLDFPAVQSSLDAMVADISAISSESSALQSTVDSSVQNLQSQIDDLSDTVDSMIEDVDTSCSYPWSYRSSVGTCIYTAYGVKASWINAKTWCESFGENYRLYKVDTAAKQRDLVCYVNYCMWDFYYDYYVGFFALSSQRYQWTDGSKTFERSSWSPGQPNNWRHGCGVVKNNAGLRLDDVNCDAVYKFICEKIIS